MDRKKPAGKQQPSGSAVSRTGGSRRKKKKRSKTGRLLLFCFAAAVLATVCAALGYYLIVWNGERLLEEYKDKMVMSEISTVYDADGNPVATLYRENRELVSFKEIPPLLMDAFIATEDKRFMEHTGIDFWAIGRALVTDIMSWELAEGGSTITQQLARNIFENSEKTLFRKATEMAMAMALEKKYSKDQIMEMYLNRIYFGSGAYGIKAASKLYFDKPDLNDLELWEIATLAALPKAPSSYSPLRNPERSKERRAVVLKLMAEQGLITEKQRAEAAAVDYTPPAGSDGDKQKYLTFIDYVLAEAQERYGMDEDQLRRGGYKIYTTMHAKAQEILEDVYLNDRLFQKDGPEQKQQSSMVIVDHQTGGIVAMIGGREYERKGMNRALVKRQPGSAFKPIIAYAPALESGKFTPDSLLKDEQTNFNGYVPRNYDGKYRGQVTMKEAIRLSINVPAVWTLNEVGLSNGIRFAESLGFDFEKEDRNLAIALGGMSRGVTPLQMAQAYGAFANGGVMIEAHAIVKILDRNGKEIVSAQPAEKRVMSEQTAWFLTEMMQEVVRSGTGTAAKLNRPVAGKTGTTQTGLQGLDKYNRDVWFAGYTPEWSAAVWVGFDRTDKNHYVTNGSASAARIFKEVMSRALADVPVKSFRKPAGIVQPTPTPKAETVLTAEFEPEALRVKLSWTTTEDSAVFQIYRKSAEGDFALLHEVSQTSEVYDYSIQTGTEYQYYIVPYDPASGRTKEPSNTVVVSTATEEEEPPAGEPTPGTEPEETPADEDGGSGEEPGDGTEVPEEPGEDDTPQPGSPTPAEPTPGAGNGSPEPGGETDDGADSPGDDASGENGRQGGERPGRPASGNANGGGGRESLLSDESRD